jgi:hypothetical protein
MLNKFVRSCVLAACAVLLAQSALAQTRMPTADAVGTSSSSTINSSDLPVGDRLVPIPVIAKRGDMEFNGTQIVLLDGKKRQLAPGARIFGADNMLKLASSLNGTAKTKYTFEESTGLLMNVWILTPREIATPDPKPVTNN